MKKILTVVLVMSLFSCSVEPDSNVEAYDSIHPDLLGDWVLVQTSGQVPNSIQTGPAMPFQETYTLNANGTFEKTRISEGEVQKITGTVELSEMSEETENGDVQFDIYFQHQTQSPLLATCSPTSLTEHLYLTNSGRLISTFNACDGIGLEYELSIKE